MQDEKECNFILYFNFFMKLLQSGRDTVWPHDPRSGWSYCVTIPSWVVLPKSKDSEPVVVLKLNDYPVFVHTKG